jgi:hypothetical protein
MQVATVFANFANGPELGVIEASALYVVSAPSTPEPAREAVVEVAAEGQPVKHEQAKALRVYCRKRDGLMEAGNRLAGITALGERRIGQELRRAELSRGGRPAKTGPADGPVSPPTLEELNLSKDQSAAYQELAHPDVAENVILDAIAAAGDRGEWVTKADIQRAVRTTIERTGGARRAAQAPGRSRAAGRGRPLERRHGAPRCGLKRFPGQAPGRRAQADLGRAGRGTAQGGARRSRR